MEEANPNSDRYFDLSLRLLTIFVLVSLVCCIGFLSYRWIEPRVHSRQAPAIESRTPVAPSPAPAAATVAPPADQILMDPRKTFKCEERGKAVAFSDRPCDSGSVQILPLNPPQPAAPTR
ncbi:MAG TPA: hypothetical protein VGM15_13380 [Burkholderiaceae bacterium]|jgi:hypothetical protein